MSRSKGDITPAEVKELMAVGEDITRRYLGEVLDIVADTGTERAAKWVESEEAIRNLQRIRAAVNNGEELTWAVIDFWLSVLPKPDTVTLRSHVSDDQHDVLTQLGAKFGTDAAGYTTLLAQKAVADFIRSNLGPVAEPVPMHKALIASMTREQGEKFVMDNAVAFTGWSLTIHNRSRTGWEHLRGQSYDLTVILKGEPLSEAEHVQIRLITHRGRVPTVVEVNANDPFDPAKLITLEGA